MPSTDWGKRRAFANAYVQTGNAAASARAAGVPASSAHSMGYRWSRDPKVVEIIREEIDQHLRELGPVALEVVRRMLIDPATPPSTRLSAARDVLDRLGWVPPKRAEQEVKRKPTCLEDMTREELEEAVALEELASGGAAVELALG